MGRATQQPEPEIEALETSVVSILETTATDGKTYKAQFYNLDAIIAVGYRVNSYQATQFCMWATQTLRGFIIKGFLLDEDRLKQGNTAFGKDYFTDRVPHVIEHRVAVSRSEGQAPRTLVDGENES
jgi:hypothetical protein